MHVWSVDWYFSKKLTLKKIADRIADIRAKRQVEKKDEIVEEILNQGIETLYARVAETIRGLPQEARFADRLSAAVGVHISSLVGKDQTYMHVYEHLPPIIKRRSRKMREKYAQLWHDLFAGGIASGKAANGQDCSCWCRISSAG